ncbi:Leucine-rich_repeat domain superfamily [Hexamita inflata]|uniref:Leucine-rich repeat domain superfamily n=1 Tax=Hexamita inflata TaxID=28002 RepID=A0AA86Q2B8_9EUKA|nr:Leucine-rich repeat domain superfamily [Hexamita inflata]
MISNNIVDIFPLNYLRSLKELYATFNHIMFVSPLLHLNLHVIELSNNYLTDAYLLDNKQKQKQIFSQKIKYTKRNNVDINHQDKEQQILLQKGNYENIKFNKRFKQLQSQSGQLFIPRGVLIEQRFIYNCGW